MPHHRFMNAWLLYITALSGLAVCARTAHATDFDALLNGSSFVLLQVDGQKMEPSKALAKLAEEHEWVFPYVQHQAAFVQGLGSKAKSAELYLAFDLPSRPSASATLSAKGADVSPTQLEQVAGVFWPWAKGKPEQVAGEWVTMRLSDDPGNEKASGGFDLPLSQAQRDRWHAAENATEDRSVKLLVVLPDYFRDAIRELQPQVPDRFGGSKAGKLLSAFDWASISLDWQSLSGQVVVQAASEQAAAQMVDQLPEVLSAILGELGGKTVKPLTELIAKAEMQQSGSQVVLRWDDSQTLPMLQFALKTMEVVREPITQSQTATAMKKMVLGMHNYESAFGAFPTYARFDEDGKSGLSWRVHILPFIGMSELYEQFHLDEAWDSPHNIKLVEQMPSLYAPAAALGEDVEIAANHTVYASPVGEGTFFGRDKRMGFSSLSDGSSNTVAIVELSSEHAVPWTSPLEYRYDLKEPVAKLRDRQGMVTIALFDGSIKRILRDQTVATWLNAFQAADGNIIELKTE